MEKRSQVSKRIIVRHVCFYGTLDTKEKEREEKHYRVEKIHHERVSQRGIARSTGLSRNTIIKIVKKAAHSNPLVKKILPSLERPSIEGDDMWSFVHSKANEVWIWVAIERQTRTIVG
jgi:DNA invertase Pin-like site-specific DNA recombinase